MDSGTATGIHMLSLGTRHQWEGVRRSVRESMNRPWDFGKLGFLGSGRKLIFVLPRAVIEIEIEDAKFHPPFCHVIFSRFSGFLTVLLYFVLEPGYGRYFLESTIRPPVLGVMQDHITRDYL